MDPCRFSSAIQGTVCNTYYERAMINSEDPFASSAVQRTAPCAGPDDAYNGSAIAWCAERHRVRLKDGLRSKLACRARPWTSMLWAVLNARVHGVCACGSGCACITCNRAYAVF